MTTLHNIADALLAYGLTSLIGALAVASALYGIAWVAA